MRRIALKARIENHQWRYFMVGKYGVVEISRSFFKAIYEGVLRG